MHIRVKGIIESDGEIDIEQLVKLNMDLAEWLESHGFYFLGSMSLHEDEKEEEEDGA